MEILYIIIIFIIVIGILVTVHEFGHFIAARMTGMRVDTFSIGMGKRLFGYNKITGFTFGNLPEDWEGNGITDYRVAMLPIGGYVKIAGMIDESMDTSHLSEEAKPWEFRSKNTFQKTITISAGVILNFVLAVAIFAAFAFSGMVEINNTTAIGYVAPGSVAEDVGLRSGDRIISIEGTAQSEWKEMRQNLLIDQVGSDKEVLVERQGQEVLLILSGQELVDVATNKKHLGAYAANQKVMVTSVQSDRAEKLGLVAGDTILTVNSQPIFATEQFVNLVSPRANETIALEWKRGNQVLNGSVRLGEDGTVGIGIKDEFNGVAVEYSFFGAIGYGWTTSIDVIVSFFDQIGQIIKGDIAVKESIGGPVLIAQKAYESFSFGFDLFMLFVAQLSIMLAIINILPIPALDGGHLVFILLEGVMRREVPAKIKMAIQNVGMLLLFALMAVIIFIDITR